MQNHFLKGMGMLDGVKKTQPVFQLWVKGIFEIFWGFTQGTQPLGAQPHHGCEEEPNAKQKSKLCCCGDQFHPTALSNNWMRLRNNGESAGMNWDGCEMLQSPGVPGGQPSVATKKGPERSLKVFLGFSRVSVNNLVQQCPLYCTRQGMRSICTVTKEFNGLENDCRSEHPVLGWGNLHQVLKNGILVLT